MDRSLQARLQRASNMAAATGALEQGTKRGQEIRRKDQPPPPRNRPDFYPSSHSSYAESSNSQGPQGSQPQGSSWYGPSNPTYSAYNSSSPVQQQQPGYGQYPPAQQTGYPYQGTGYNPQQAPTTGQQPGYPSGTQAPGSYNHQGQYQTSHGYPPPSGPQNSASPTHFNTGYGQQPYNQTNQYSPPSMQGSSPPPNQGSPPQHNPYPPPPNTRSYSQDSYGASTSNIGRCRHGHPLSSWYLKPNPPFGCFVLIVSRCSDCSR
ncbi:MAG: hypothetical protein Q9202_002950 [Teloschistes flavicans]